jgi:hypothetical protein
MKTTKFILVLIATLFAGENKQPIPSSLIDSLVNSNINFEYYDDGAGDGTVMEIGSNADGKVLKPPHILMEIIKLGDSAIPILISHLDDSRETNLTFNSKAKIYPVTIGYICLDLLTAITKSKSLLYENDCGDDGICACSKKGFCFRPDDFIVQSGSRKPNKRVIVPSRVTSPALSLVCPAFDDLMLT